MTTEETLKNRIFTLIDEKKQSMMAWDDHLDFVSNIIKDLNSFIDDEKCFTESEIEEMLKNLVQYRVVLDIPIPKNTLLLRAVKIGDGYNYPNNTKVSRLSYIPRDELFEAKLGRCNKAKQSIYYACLANSIKDVNVPFSERGVKEKEHINILISKTSKELNLRFIGLYDYYKRGTVPPFEVHDFFEEVHQYYIDTHDETLLSAIELCDSFFCDIFRRKGHCKLYQVTSVLSDLFMLDRGVDGLIYPSVETEGSPNIAIKPNSVDSKILHQEVRIFFIQRVYGYSKYYAINFNTVGKIHDKENIWWSDTLIV